MQEMTNIIFTVMNRHTIRRELIIRQHRRIKSP